MSKYDVFVARWPSLGNATFDPRTAPCVGSAETIRAAVRLAKREWRPGWAYTVRTEGRCVRTIWEDGSVT